MSTVEILPEGCTATGDADLVIDWPRVGSTTGGQATFDTDPFFTPLGTVPDSAIDLARTAVGAYLADRLLPRSSIRWSRDITLVVHQRAPDRFATAASILEGLLFWVSGDAWNIEVVADTTDRPDGDAVDSASTVALASGGLDSLCGALLAPVGTVFVGQNDSKATAHAQKLVVGDLSPATYQRVRFQANRSRERSSRSRSVMFTALGTAAASARGAKSLIVPENGFTSLNPPLAANRGGPHTTRSTHPTTFAYANALNEALGVKVCLENPYAWLTKGELVAAAASQVGVERVESIVPHTYSCARSNGHFFKGGSAFLNCGICVACMTRRGAVRTAGIQDHTEYLIERLRGKVHAQFLAERGDDLPVVRALAGWQPDETTLTAMGPFPDGFDYARAAELLQRGVEELVRGLP